MIPQSSFFHLQGLTHHCGFMCEGVSQSGVSLLFRAISSNQCSALRILEFGFVYLPYVESICSHISLGTSLLHLSLATCSLSDDRAANIIRCLHEANASLEVLNLRDNRLANNTVLALQSLIEERKCMWSS